MNTKKLIAGILACVMVMAGVPAIAEETAVMGADNPILSAAEELLHPGQNVITFAEDEYSKDYILVFDSDPVLMMRYEIAPSDGNTEIAYNYSRGSKTKKGTFRFNDKPGTRHTITVRRASAAQQSVTLTVRKMPEVTSITAANDPTRAAAPTWVFDSPALEELLLDIHYSGGETERIRLAEFSGNRSPSGYYQDVNLTQAINTSDLPAYYNGGGRYCYQRIQLEVEGADAGAWYVIVKYRLTPYIESDYPWIQTDGTRLKITNRELRMFRVSLPKAGYYDFCGLHAEAFALGGGDGEMWGGYNGTGSVNHGYQNAGDVWVSARLREDENGNPSSEGYIWCTPQAEIQAVDLEVSNSSNLTWGNWTENIKKVIQYKDPKTEAIHTYKTDVENYNASDNGYSLQVICRIDPVDSGAGRYKFTVEEEFGNIYARKKNRPILRCEKEVTIKSVSIADNVNADTGSRTGSVISQSLSDVVNGSGGSASDGTAERIEQIRAADEKANEEIRSEGGVGQDTQFSANLEISQASDAGEIQLAQNQAAEGETVEQVLDATVVVRGDAETLGTIEETSSDVELAVEVSDYDPNKDYSICRIHKGKAQKLDVFKVERTGTGAKLWFRSKKFSTFAVIVGKTTQDNKTSDKKDQGKQVKITSKPVISKVTAAKKGKVTLNWKKFARKTKKAKTIWNKIKKVEIQYSTDRTFKKNVKKKVVGKNKTKLVIKKLKNKTTYYFRIRYTDGKSGYSDWSKVKKVKTKKK